MAGNNLVWDWHLHCPVVVSNGVFRTLLNHDEQGITDVDIAFIKELKKTYAFERHESLVMGGIAQGVAIPRACQVSTKSWITDNDVDVYVTTQTPVNDFTTVQETNPGFVKLKLFDSRVASSNLYALEGDPASAYLISKPFLKGIPDMKDGKTITFPDIPKQNIKQYNTPRPSWAHSFAFKLPYWPKAAREWQERTRESDWPPKAIIETARTDGCFIVPYSDTTWRLAFPMTELRLMNSLSPVQKHIFTLLKIIFFQKLGCPRVLGLEHLRASFMRMCEEVEAASWRADQTTALLMYGIDSLLHQVISDHLPHYFIPNLNLLDGLSEDFLIEVQVGLAQARTEALHDFIQYNLAFQLPYTMGVNDEVFKPVYTVTRNGAMPRDASNCVLQVLIPFLVRLAMARIEQASDPSPETVHKIIAAMHAGAKQLLKENGLDCGDALWGLLTINTHHNTDLAVHFYEYALYEDPSQKRKASLYGNLGCVYHVKWHNTADEIYKEKAMEVFEKAMNDGTSNTSNKTDYIVFLCNIGEWKKANKLMLEVIQSEDYGEANGYDDNESSLLHPDLQALVQEVPGSMDSIPAMAHVSFLYLTQPDTELQQDREKVIGRFMEICAKAETSEDHDSTITSYVLLGIALERLSQQAQAVNAYSKATILSQSHGGKQWGKWLEERQNMLKQQGYEKNEIQDEDPNENDEDEQLRRAMELSMQVND